MRKLTTLMIFASLISAVACTGHKSSSVSKAGANTAQNTTKGDSSAAGDDATKIEEKAAQNGDKPAEGPTSDALPAGETLLDWKLPDTRVELAETVAGIPEGSHLVAFKGAIVVDDNAEFRMFDVGAGMYCSIKAPKQVAKGDEFSFVRATQKDWPKDKHGKIVTLLYRNAAAKTELSFGCIVLNEQKPADFVATMKDIVQFRDEKGAFPPYLEEHDADYYLKADNKFRSFKILNADVFAQIDAHKMDDKVMAITGGKLMTTKDAQMGIDAGTMKEACQVSKLTGTLRTDAIYKWTDTQNLGSDSLRGTAMLNYTFEASDKDKVDFNCIIRLDAPFDILLETLAGVVEFGVAK